MNPSKTTSKSVIHALMISLLAVVMVGLLSACAGAPKKENLGIQIAASADVNPDMEGRPSPVILHIMELNSTEQFNRLDYMGLTQPSGAALGPELLGKNQVVLQPGESKTLPMELNAATTAIGLVAGYRDIDNAAWRKIVPITQGKTKGISITLEQTQIVTAVSE
ncbi:MAG: type VI secretion system lipoprotein TssJ [Lysobacterales bacterium]